MGRLRHKPLFISLLFLILFTTFTYFTLASEDDYKTVEESSHKQTNLNYKTVPPDQKRAAEDHYFKRIGYYAGWSAYSGFNVTDIDASKLTHLNYAFANISEDGKIAVGDPAIDLANFQQLQELKKQNLHLKTLISVGGWTWSERFSDVALTEQSRTKFAESVLAFVQKYGFDGVDLDWEYPVSGGQPDNINRPEDKHNYTLLLKKIRETFDAADKAYLLTIASGASAVHASHLELDQLHRYVDYIQLMTYDIHGEWDELTGMNAPLYQDPDSRFYHEWSVHNAVQMFIERGVPAEQIVMGLPLYGRMFKQPAEESNSLYQPFTGGGKAISYAALERDFIGKNGFTKHWEEDSQVPWLTDNSTFISYDDPKSIGLKTDYIKAKQLGGAMMWELSQDPDEVLVKKVYKELKE
ncbi:glycoside hydrolase family 18 protein [Pseudalkalibacillus berkeleyi]|uniref:chitinase n=1 Tax=Pseudalkalibacillus berkeleyi TaxID=1069813 RepID=A0ABS9GXX0_9BACL|nr:glycoside hydrolase family 18 protein [Pseudalkalibacillus berkeleyi]MCF6136521.1 glycoside hydrolase family 18 protein [Pseudalkalibacillus berkeleyi]